MTATDDAVVANYLGWLNAAALSLPADRRAELVDEITAHIAEARAEGPNGGTGTGADLLDLLARIGSPDEIVRAASEQATDSELLQAAAASTASSLLPPAPASSLPPPGPASSPAAPAPARPGALEIAAVALSIGSAAFLVLPAMRGLAFIGWIAGVVLLWLSPRLRTSDKLLGTFVWPVGIGLALALLWLPTLGVDAFVPRVPGVGALYLAGRAVVPAAAIVAAVSVAVRLLRRAGRVAA